MSNRMKALNSHHFHMVLRHFFHYLYTKFVLFFDTIPTVFPMFFRLIYDNI